MLLQPVRGSLNGDIHVFLLWFLDVPLYKLSLYEITRIKKEKTDKSG
ncbi:BnaUnng04870D [Brassica napus]|uniref:BnaUnng04870D protein n=1 Tax=Brassica napus TaxID=3708 RepID=A0A078K2K3_BRANA|nr:BnaUnng04870D [Brassica napus]